MRGPDAWELAQRHSLRVVLFLIDRGEVIDRRVYGELQVDRDRPSLMVAESVRGCSHSGSSSLLWRLPLTITECGTVTT